MKRRYVSIWFPHLIINWMQRNKPALTNKAFVITKSVHGKMVVVAANGIAKDAGIVNGISLADASALAHDLLTFNEEPNKPQALLHGMAIWLIRYTPLAGVSLPDGLILDISGCAHLWGGEANYVASIRKRFEDFGYYTRIAVADTIAATWGIVRYSKEDVNIIPIGEQTNALLPFPVAALQLDAETMQRLVKLGLSKISNIINIKPATLRRRFGSELLHKLGLALGNEEDFFEPVIPAIAYRQILPCMSVVLDAQGIQTALKILLQKICTQLGLAQKGLRTAIFTCHKSDRKVCSLQIQTHRASNNSQHLFKLFEDKISSLSPEPGIELFVLEATTTEALTAQQDQFFQIDHSSNTAAVALLLDRIGGKIGNQNIYRFQQSEDYWPERSFKPANILDPFTENTQISTKPRPIQLLTKPASIAVTAPVPDYPPMNFRYKGKLHKIMKADGPERIEQVWWIQEGAHRDYYVVEDEEGLRYWLFRLGHYNSNSSYQWFLHGFFA